MFSVDSKITNRSCDVSQHVRIVYLKRVYLHNAQYHHYNVIFGIVIFHCDEQASYRPVILACDCRGCASPALPQ